MHRSILYRYWCRSSAVSPDGNPCRGGFLSGKPCAWPPSDSIGLTPDPGRTEKLTLLRFPSRGILLSVPQQNLTLMGADPCYRYTAEQDAKLHHAVNFWLLYEFVT